jgi:hypothetical protein
MAKLVTLAQSISGAGGDSAVITRLMQQVTAGQQMVSVANLPHARTLAQSATAQHRATTLKIQGGKT